MGTESVKKLIVHSKRNGMTGSKRNTFLLDNQITEHED
jgi:hypothetical protein